MLFPLFDHLVYLYPSLISFHFMIATERNMPFPSHGSRLFPSERRSVPLTSPRLTSIVCFSSPHLFFLLLLWFFSHGTLSNPFGRKRFSFHPTRPSHCLQKVPAPPISPRISIVCCSSTRLTSTRMPPLSPPP